jgi:predicted metal-dependent hydrolase
VRDAIKVLRRKMSEGKVKCYVFSGIAHGKFKAGEIRLDGSSLDRINTTTLLHEAVHAEHAERFPKAAKEYSENEGKDFKEDDPKVRDLLRWKAYTEYWAYRSRLDYYESQKPEDQRQTDAELHKTTLLTRDVLMPIQAVRRFDPSFDPRKWKPKG